MLSTAKIYLRILGARGLLSAAGNKLSGKSSLFCLRRSDLRHPLYLRIPSSDTFTYKQVFLDHEYDFGVNDQPRVIVDAGANIGLASVLFANRYPSAKIIAIEPESSNFELLKMNVAPYDNVIPLQAALWNRNEEINLVDPGRGKWGFMTAQKNLDSAAASAVCHTVRAMTVDRLLAEQNIDSIDILKIDIEGAEKEVFNDTSAWIGRVGAIIIELHERMKAGCNRTFYRGSEGFDREWTQGENVYLSRSDRLRRLSS
jgi:FkbM family methyltransferase